MKRNTIPAAVFATLCAGPALSDVPRVVVDIAPVHSLVSQVMAGVGTPDLLLPPGASPHGYSMRPSEARSLSQSDIVFWVGEGLTPWLETSLDSLAASATHVALLDVPGAVLLETRDGVGFAPQKGDAHSDRGEDDHDDHDEHGAHEDEHEDHAHDAHADADHDDHGEKAHDDHGHEEHAHDDHGHDEHADEKHEDGHDDHGHDHAHAGGMDPHAWLSPQNATIWLQEIAQILGTTDPENAAQYTANAARAAADLSDLRTEVTATLASVQGKPFIVYHDAFQYFEDSFDMPAVGAFFIGDASQPSPIRVAIIRDFVAEAGATCVLSEPQYNAGLVQAVDAENTGVVDPLGAEIAPGPDLYAQVLRNIATSLAACISGK